VRDAVNKGFALMRPQPPSGSPTGALPDVHDIGGGRGYFASLTLPNRIESVRPAAMFLVHAARALNISAAARPLFEVAVSEVLTNAVKHGHSVHERDVIHCELELTPGQLTMRILDSGPGFDVPPPRVGGVADEVETLRESGYGLPIVQSVFPVVRAIHVNGRFGLELILPRL